jgi:hypothetical protein
MPFLLFFLVFLSGTLLAANLQIDHVTACGADVKKMQAALENLGIHSQYGGPHAGKVSEMALASFADGSYLELIAIQPDTDPKLVPGHEWGKQMQANAGPCAWAARSRDVAAEINRLKTAGIKVSEPERSGRARPDGVRLDWETAQVGDRTRGTYFPFLIRDFTARTARVFPAGKPTAANIEGVAKIVVAVQDLPRAIEDFRRAFELPAPRRETNSAWKVNLAAFDQTPLVLAQPLGTESWVAERVRQFGEGPVAIALGSGSLPGKLAGERSTWFGKSIVWLDAQQLGWHLGVE